MKTQISNLISGLKDVRRDESHPKYAGAAMATSHIGYAGTNSAIRQDIAAKVIAENPEQMRIDILGREFILKASRSCSGKSISYSTDISDEDFTHITGRVQPFTTYEHLFTLVIFGDMYVRVDMFARKSPAAQWKCRGWVNIGEEFIKILD